MQPGSAWHGPGRRPAKAAILQAGLCRPRGPHTSLVGAKMVARVTGEERYGRRPLTSAMRANLDRSLLASSACIQGWGEERGRRGKERARVGTAREGGHLPCDLGGIRTGLGGVQGEISTGPAATCRRHESRATRASARERVTQELRLGGARRVQGCAPSHLFGGGEGGWGGSDLGGSTLGGGGGRDLSCRRCLGCRQERRAGGGGALGRGRGGQ
jgi:hypothetical protein